MMPSWFRERLWPPWVLLDDNTDHWVPSHTVMGVLLTWCKVHSSLRGAETHVLCGDECTYMTHRLPAVHLPSVCGTVTYCV